MFRHMGQGNLSRIDEQFTSSRPQRGPRAGGSAMQPSDGTLRLVGALGFDAAPRQALAHLPPDDAAPRLANLHALLEDLRLDLAQVLTERALVEAHELIQLRLTQMGRVDRDERVHELRQVASSSREERIPEGAGDLRIGGPLCRYHRLHSAQRKASGAGQIQQAPNGGGFRSVYRPRALLREYGSRQYRRSQRPAHQATSWSGHEWVPR